MTFKKIIHQLHLWLGLASGLLVFVIALTGAVYAFQKEIQDLAPYRSVEEQKARFLLPSNLQHIAQSALPGKLLHSVKYNDRKSSAEAVFYNYKPSYYYTVYIDPYTGKLLKIKDMDRNFFQFILKGHFYLWLPPQIGQPIVAYACLIFVFIVISGLVIWFPKNRKGIKYRVWFRWNKDTKWPRMNFDLHVVLGLYATVFALIFAVTGLVWSFQWFEQSYYKVLGGKKSLNYTDLSPYKNQSDTIESLKPNIDKVYELMQHQYPKAASIEVHPPQNDSTCISVNATPVDGRYGKTDYRFFDQHSLREVKFSNVYGQYSDANFADRMIRMNYDIHTGSILGFTGKLIAFLMSLLIASFPITGFIIWWRKKRSKATAILKGK